jgi:hypothetical protein
MLLKETLIELARKNGFQGDGSETNPYIFTSIEDFSLYEAQNSRFIRVYGSDLFITFKGIRVQPETVLHFKKCTNLTFERCTINSLNLYKSTHVSINDCEFTNLHVSGGYDATMQFSQIGGLHVNFSHGVNVYGCEITHLNQWMSRGNTYKETDILIYNPRSFESGLNLRITFLVYGLFAIGFSAVASTIMRMEAVGNEFEISLSIFALILMASALFSYSIWEIITSFKMRKYAPNKIV